MYALRHNMAKFIEAGTQRVHDLGAMMNQAFARSKQNCLALLICSFQLHKPHFWALGCHHDSFSIGSIIFHTLHERANVLWGNQFYLMALSVQFACPVMRAAAGFQNHDGWFMLGHEFPKHRA